MEGWKKLVTLKTPVFSLKQLLVLSALVSGLQASQLHVITSKPTFSILELTDHKYTLPS